MFADSYTHIQPQTCSLQAWQETGGVIKHNKRDSAF